MGAYDHGRLASPAIFNNAGKSPPVSPASVFERYDGNHGINILSNTADQKFAVKLEGRISESEM